MNKTNFNSYMQSHQISGHQISKRLINDSSEYCSPFRKHLPIIFETQSSPHKQFATQKMDYLQSQYQSRLIAVDQSLFGSGADYSIPNDSQLLNQRQRQMLTKIYEKEKQLVVLQDRIYLLKNTNECLRDTIKENDVQKEKLSEQIQELINRNKDLQQKIVQLKQKIQQLQKQNEIMNNLEQGELGLDQFRSKSRQELVQQNNLLKKQIQSIKQFYEQQFYRILQRNQQSMKIMQQKIKDIQNEKQYINELKQKLQKDLNVQKEQKKAMLEYYLKIIQQMRSQIQQLRTINLNTLPLMSEKSGQQNLIDRKIRSQIYAQNLINKDNNNHQQYKSHNYPGLNTNEQIYRESSNNSQKKINLGQIMNIKRQNQLLKGLLLNINNPNKDQQTNNQKTNNSNSVYKDSIKDNLPNNYGQYNSMNQTINKSGSTSLLINLNQNHSNYLNQQLSHLNHSNSYINNSNSYIIQNLSKFNTSHSYQQNSFLSQKYTDRQFIPTSRNKFINPKSLSKPFSTKYNKPYSPNHHDFKSYKLSPKKYLSSQIIALHIQNQTSSYYKKHHQIDKKLQSIKQKLTHQITY